MKRKQIPKPQVVVSDEDDNRAPYWEFFFRDQRNPVLRSQLITALMSGHILEVERLPKAVLLDVVLLATATRKYHDAEIIDDFKGLLRHTDEVWRAPMWSTLVFDQAHTNAAGFIVKQGEDNADFEFQAFEDLYIPDLAKWLLENEPPEYFTKAA